MPKVVIHAFNTLSNIAEVTDNYALTYRLESFKSER
jgi:hypothetical protein